jgi:SulP family sulfate permease
MSRTPQDRNKRLLDELAAGAEGNGTPAAAPRDAPAARGPAAPPPPALPRAGADLFAGLVVGVVTLTFSVSCGALIFSGGLARHLPLGLAAALISACLTALVVAWRSPLPFAIAGPDSHGSAILALMAAAIAAAPAASDEATLATVLAAITLSTVVTGVFLFALGRLGCGHWVRYIPYPVVGGFLAGAGWLITRGSFVVMADAPLNAANLGRLAEPLALAHWLPGLCLAVLLRAVVGRARHFLAMPLVLVGAVAFFHLAWGLLGAFGAAPAPDGWFLVGFSGGQLREAWAPATLAAVDWPVLTGQAANLVTLLVVVVVAILLNATGVEIATQTDTDLNRELRANGLANVLAGLCGGMVGYLSLSRSLLNYQAHARGRLAGLTAGLFCAAVLFFGGDVVRVFPRPVVGGLLLYLGLGLLLEWVYAAWFKLSRTDYFLVVAILAVIALTGFIEGVAAGVVVACIVFVYNYSRHRAIRHAFTGATHPSNVERPPPQQRFLREHGEQISVLALQGYLFFGTASSLLDHVRRRLDDPARPRLRFLVFDFRLVSGLDSSAVFGFVKMRQLGDKLGVCQVFTGLQPAVRQRLEEGGCLGPDDPLCQTFADLDRGLEWCENQLLASTWSRRRKAVPLALQLTELFPEAGQAQAFMAYLERLAVPAGHVLYKEGEAADAMYFIESGQVTVLLRTEAHGSLRLQTLSAGTTVGEMALFTRGPHRTSAVAEEPSTLFRLSADGLDHLRREAPPTATVFQDFIIRLLADRLTLAYQEIDVFSR